MKQITLLLLLTIITACGGTNSSEKTEKIEPQAPSKTEHHIPALSAIFDAHGGYDTWSDLKMMEYKNGGSKTLVDLQSRYTRIESENQTVGFDGQDVWVMPPSENADRQRMRYNLMFYFYAFPFVVGDPGTNYEMLDPVELDGTAYDAVKVSYDNGVGDSPNDSYIILADQETHQMQWLMYTATFGAEEKSDRYSLIKYEGWEERGGVILPSSLQWYQYSDGVVGEPRGGARLFEEIKVSTEHPAMRNFEMPEGAQVAKLPGEG